MANAFTVSDDVLQETLQRWLNSRLGETWSIRTFKNDVTPDDDTILTDLVESDYPGYASQPFQPDDFDGVVVVDHIAIAAMPTPLQFEADATGFASQLCYGYFVTDGANFMLWVERFENVRTIFPYDKLDITPTLRNRTCRET